MSQWPPAMQLLGIGWYVAVCIVGGVLLGLWLDRELGISPALTLAGLGLGLAAAGWGGYRMLQQLFAAQQQRDSRTDGDSEGSGGMSRTRLIVIATIVLAVVGFFLMRAPAPVIALAAEPVISIGSYEITNTILSAWVVIALLAIAAFVVYRRTRDVESALVPSGFQNLVEAIYDAFMNIAQQVGGERNGRKFFPFVFTIFIFLLIGNWFALFPWNNVIGPVENYRYHYLHEMEISVVEVVEDLESGERELSSGEIDAINKAFQSSFFMPIHFSDYETGSFQETHAQSDVHIAELMAGQISDLEADVRAEFLSEPLPSDLHGEDLEHALAERLEAAGVDEKYVHDAIFYNLPLAAGDAELVPRDRSDSEWFRLQDHPAADAVRHAARLLLRRLCRAGLHRRPGRNLPAFRRPRVLRRCRADDRQHGAYRLRPEARRPGLCR